MLPGGAFAVHPQAAGRRDDHVRPPRQLPGLLLHVQAAHYHAVLCEADTADHVSMRSQRVDPFMRCLACKHDEQYLQRDARP